MGKLSVILLMIVVFVGCIVSMATVSAATSVKLQFFNGNTAASINTLYVNFKLVNTGMDPITLSNVKLRYYFTNDGTLANSFACDWSTVGNSNVTGSFMTISPVTNADRYLEVGFTSGAGTLAAGSGIEVKGRVWKSDWSNFTQTNDYSFNASATNYVDSTTITAYISGTLYWGTPAGGSAVTPTPTSITNTPTPIWTITPSPIRTATSTPSRTPTPVPTPTATGIQQKTVRVFWLIPSDVSYDQKIFDGIGNVMKEAQRYYFQELGKTFHLNNPIVEVCYGDHTKSWYETTPNGDDSYWWTINNMVNELMRKYSLNQPDSRWVIVAYISADGNGGGGNGWVVLPKHDTDGAGGYRAEPMNRWYGGMVHELGHAFGQPDSTYTDGTPLSASFYDYPNCHFNADQKNKLLTNSYNIPFWYSTY